MALVSPGISISVSDQSQFVSSSVGSIPLVIMATAQDKSYNGTIAAGTTKASAGKLQAFTSQRDLITNMGAPVFQLSATNTPVNGSELNEYGLMAAYSALGLSNQLYAIRADIDLNQLAGTGNRPVSAPANNTYWLDLANTEFGLYELQSATSAFTHVAPLLITDTAQVYDDNAYAYSVPTPLPNIGTVGSYAWVLTDTNGMEPSVLRLFYKAGPGSYGGIANTWVQLGSAAWQQSRPVLTATIANPTLPTASVLTFANYPAITTTGTTAATLANDINNAAIPGVFANVNATGQLQLFVTSAARSGGSSAPADGKITITSFVSPASANLLTTIGITATSYYCPYLFYGNYAQQPAGGWFSTDTQPRPTGSVWFKLGSTGTGANPVFKKYSNSLSQWQTQTVPLYATYAAAIYGLDPTGGGTNIPGGQIVGIFGLSDTTANNFEFVVSGTQHVSTATGGQLGSATPFTTGNAFTIQATSPGISGLTSYTITLSSNTSTGLVSDILAANIPYVSAEFNPNDGAYGSITITHSAGGQIILTNTSGTPLNTAGFVDGSGAGFDVNSVTGVISISNFTNITADVHYSAAAPYTPPASGTLWYYSNLADVDIMINNNGWKGYRNVTSDARGFNLANTDPAGVIISAGQAPLAHTDGNSLVPGDLWLDSADLANWPSLYRYNGVAWLAIDKTDHVSSNGIIFADARWDTSGTTDIIDGDFPSIAGLLTSNYLDQDAPDYRLYPRGTLLFNTRRSGYNVKKYVPDYFNSTRFSTPGQVPGTLNSLPTIKDAWVSVSGLKQDGSMYAGTQAQRALIVDAMAAAVNSNTDILEDIYPFNLICAPGYHEVTPSLINLNNNRANTGFIIADTPMTLKPNVIDITQWTNNATGTGLPSVAAADPYTAIYYPAGLTSDLSGHAIVVPASHAALRTFLYSDNVSHPWFSPAGVTRGLVSNLSDIGYINANTGAFVHNSINQGLRDALYTLDINPITQLPNTGLVIWGQKTRAAGTTSRNSINVVRLENYLRTILKSISNAYLFEPNDQITRTSIARQIESALNAILSKRGLYDFLVICDTTNNTPSTIANQQLYVDVAIEPMRDVEFIYIPIALYNPGEIGKLNASST
jgi:Phage tail sheath C-terminal domain